MASCQRAKTETIQFIMPKMSTIQPFMETVGKLLINIKQVLIYLLLVSLGTIPNPICNNASWKNTFLTSEQMNSEPFQLIYWGQLSPLFGFIPGWCREERPSGTVGQSVLNGPQVPFGAFVFLRTLGWQSQPALSLHVILLSKAMIALIIPWLCSSLSMEKEQDATCLSVSQENKNGWPWTTSSF